MDGTTGRPDRAGSHIWLRYTTQFPVGERINTIEMGIPVPLGASEEERASILREADMGMDQLAKHVESRATRMQQSSSSQATGAAAAAASTKPSVPAASTTASASLPKGPARTPPRDAAPESKEKATAVPLASPNIGASMPSTPGLAGNASENLQLPQFIQFIKDRLNLTPKEAMDKLNVKSLNGVNLREAFEQLQHMANLENNYPASAEQSAGEAETTASNRAYAKKPAAQAEEHTSQPAPAAPILPTNKMGPDLLEIKHAVIREIPPGQAFDEEVDDEEFGPDLVEDEEFPSALTDNERGIAQGMLGKLRETRGSSAAGQQRLRALHNVIDSQLSEEQLLELIQGVWGVSADNKLKSEQVETLISWAKQDAFVEEAEVVLALLQENAYARSDR